MHHITADRLVEIGPLDTADCEPVHHGETGRFVGDTSFNKREKILVTSQADFYRNRKILQAAKTLQLIPF